MGNEGENENVCVCPSIEFGTKGYRKREEKRGKGEKRRVKGEKGWKGKKGARHTYSGSVWAPFLCVGRTERRKGDKRDERMKGE